MLNQETKWTSPSLTPCTKHHPTKITQESGSPGGLGELLSWEAVTSSPARRPRQACSQFSLFRKSLSVLSFSPDLVFFPSLLLLGFLLCRNSYSSDRERCCVRVFWEDRGRSAASWPWRVSSSGFRLALSGVSGVTTSSTLLPNWKVNMDVGSNIITAIGG